MLNFNKVTPVTLKAEKKKKPISQKKLMANQINGTKSPGPIDTTNSKYNATKHGLLRLGISELDNAEGHKKLLKRLMMERNPVGHTEVFLVESAALDMVRLQRARRLEAEYISSALHPPKYKDAMPTEEELYKGTLVDEGYLAVLDPKQAQPLVSIYQRYEAILFSRLQKTLHELERLQRMRLGECLPAPAALDVTVHADVNQLNPEGSVPVIDQPSPQLNNDGVQ
jgi:hypothetical protein